MEDALARTGKTPSQPMSMKSLNPCFNGRCTRTVQDLLKTCEKLGVLILVLMEDALAL